MTDTVARSSHRILETERLHLREAVDRDEPGFIRYIDDRKVRTLDDARGYIGKLRDHYWRHGFGLYVVASRSEEHTSELQSLMRISYAVFCLKKKRKNKRIVTTTINKNDEHIH